MRASSPQLESPQGQLSPRTPKEKCFRLRKPPNISRLTLLKSLFPSISRSILLSSRLERYSVPTNAEFKSGDGDVYSIVMRSVESLEVKDAMREVVARVSSIEPCVVSLDYSHERGASEEGPIKFFDQYLRTRGL